MTKSRIFPDRRMRLRSVLASGLILGCMLAPVSHAEDLDRMSEFVGLMQSFMLLMDSMYAAASNPEHAALLQMNSLEDMYKESGQLASMIDVYRDVAERATNPTVRRLAKMRLADTLKETGRMEEAIKELTAALKETVADANQQ